MAPQEHEDPLPRAAGMLGRHDASPLPESFGNIYVS
jgi:hypothetical protein